jgi:hypothetical protein
MDPESARVIGTLIGLPVAMILGALVYYVLFINIVRRELRKSLNGCAGAVPGAPDLWAGGPKPIDRLSSFGSAGGAVGGALVGVVLGTAVGFREAGPSGLLFGAGLGVGAGGGVGFGAGAVFVGRKLQPGASASAQFSLGLLGGVGAVALAILLLIMGAAMFAIVGQGLGALQD